MGEPETTDDPTTNTQDCFCGHKAKGPSALLSHWDKSKIHKADREYNTIQDNK